MAHSQRGNEYGYKVERSRYYVDIRVICTFVKVLIGPRLSKIAPLDELIERHFIQTAANFCA